VAADRVVKRQFWRGLALAASALLAACATAPCDPSQGDVLQIYRAGGKPVVPVEVNGRRVPFLVDTGASATALFQESADSLRVAIDPRRNTLAWGVAGESRQQNALVGQLRVGQREMTNLTVPVVTHSNPGRLPMVGLIGADILRGSELEIDFPGQRFVLHDARACRAGTPPWQDEYDTIPVEVLPSGLVRLRMRVNGIGVWGLLDSGADHSTMLRSTAQRLEVPSEALDGKPVGVVHGVGGTRLELRVQRFDTVEIGAETLRDVPMGIIDLQGTHPFGLVLGLEYFVQRRLWLSYTRQRLYVQRVAPVAEGGRKAPM
jgi:predicted aspartyl protease